MKEPFVFLDHTADIKIQIRGVTLSEIFENVTLALANYWTGGKAIKPKKGKVIEVQGTDTESLLSNYIDELLFLLDAEGFATAKAQVTLRGNNLKAELYGDDAKHYSIEHVKAATYAEMYIKKTKDGWEAQVVLDV